METARCSSCETWGWASLLVPSPFSYHSWHADRPWICLQILFSSFEHCLQPTVCRICLETPPIGHKNIVSQDRWSLPTGSVALQYGISARNMWSFKSGGLSQQWSFRTVGSMYKETHLQPPRATAEGWLCAPISNHLMEEGQQWQLMAVVQIERIHSQGGNLNSSPMYKTKLIKWSALGSFSSQILAG